MKCTHTLTLFAVGLALCAATAHGAKLSVRPGPNAGGGDSPDGNDDGTPRPPRPTSITFAGGRNPFLREYDNANPTPAPTHENEGLRSGCSACIVNGCGEGNCDGVMYCGADGGGNRGLACTTACPACPTPAPSPDDDDEDAVRGSRNDVRRSMAAMRAAFERLRATAAANAKAAFLGCVETTGCDYDYTWFAAEAKREAFLEAAKLVEAPEGLGFAFDEKDEDDTAGIRLRERPKVDGLVKKVYWDEPKVDGDDTAGIRLRERTGPEESRGDGKAFPGFGSFLPKASGAREFTVPEAAERSAPLPAVPSRSAPKLRGGGNSGFLAKEEDAKVVAKASLKETETEEPAVEGGGEAKVANTTTTVVAIAGGSAVALLALGAVAWRYRPHRREEAGYATQV